MSKIWFSSDFHGYHKNICSGSTSWERFEEGSSHQQTRPFNDQYEMTNKLVENINKVVSVNDTLYFLGDWSFGGLDNVWNLRKQILCKNIYFIYGNHDHHIEKNAQICIPNSEFEIYRKIGRRNAHESMYHGDNFYVHTQDLFKGCTYYMELKIGKHHFVLSHFAFRVWNKSHHGSINLYGHSHGSLPDYEIETSTPTTIGGMKGVEIGFYKARCMDVGVDTHPEFRPYSLEEILKIMENRGKLVVDHHNTKTN